MIGIARFAAEIDFDTASQLVDLLETARTDDRVAGVVLEILSPGGFATSSETLYYTLLKLREQKPLVVVIDGLAASGGYYMAAAGNRIYAPASAYVGNVGTRGGRPSDPSIAPDELSSGPYKLEGGSRFDQSQCNTKETDAKGTTAVNQYPKGASPFGVCDMLGNVWEWCSNGHASGEINDVTVEILRVVRGGSFMSPRKRTSLNFHYILNPLYRYQSIGFRIACETGAEFLNI